MPGSVFLREARRCAPTAVRMLLTGYADSDAAAAAVNDGQIFRYLTKPCDRHELKRACAARAVRSTASLVAERELLEQTLHGAIKALTDVLALASPAAFGRSARLKDLTAGSPAPPAPATRGRSRSPSMLVNLGAVTLPEATAEKLHSGGALEPNEVGMVDARSGGHRPDPGQHPAARGRARDRRRPSRALRLAGELPEGARMLRIAVDFVALEAEGAEAFLALETMRGRDGVYDPELLETFARTVGVRTPLAGGLRGPARGARGRHAARPRRPRPRPAAC